MNAAKKETIRAFIAIELPAELQKEIASIQQHLKPFFSRAKVSWVRPENIHLTLKFLGDVISNDISNIINVCDDSRLISVFELHLNRIGFFPGLRKPKVLWCGYDGSDALSSVQSRIENALVPLGFPAESKPFTAHLTLARIKEIDSNPSAHFYVDMEAVQEFIHKTQISIHHPVYCIKLIKSRLSPKGSEYKVLHEWVLQQERI